MAFYLITDYGAKPGEMICTREIQRAIDECFICGGGTVVVPKGVFHTGGVRLRSRVTLLLRDGAVLKGTRNPEDYLSFLDDALEPIDEELKAPRKWLAASTEISVATGAVFDWMKTPTSRWNNGLIRALDAEDVAVIGEGSCVIDGSDCYDPEGEEFYRGPHGMSFHNCKGVHLSGYTIQNTGNWAHALFSCQDVDLERVTVLAGHDGVHLTTCDRVQIADCAFYTGDDCVAGIDDIDVTVTRCVMNTACSAFRIGGTHIYIRDCELYGPAKYLFRGSLTLEEKQSGVSSPTTQGHRYNMLSAFTYYCDYSREIRQQPGDIHIDHCRVKNVDRFVHYNFSGNEPWQRQRPLADIHFAHVEAKGLRMPLTLYGDDVVKLSCTIKDCEFSFDEQTDAFIHTANMTSLEMARVRVKGLGQMPLIRRWSRIGEMVLRDVADEEAQGTQSVLAEEPFVCTPI